ncbi:hypothetical protein CCACVL1_10774 [Corchorus capsularis]|uniref:Uncharacterized protein n=1 Tax=Corchorus capsularis TaxID=210143 RepID=A0A1R3IPQ4_COCAP|nr:hypothetical protein CCACVL1_10774 [Corchorus capsularis]
MSRVESSFGKLKLDSLEKLEAQNSTRTRRTSIFQVRARLVTNSSER